jgi:hypothetical protein
VSSVECVDFCPSPCALPPLHPVPRTRIHTSDRFSRFGSFLFCLTRATHLLCAHCLILQSAVCIFVRSHDLKKQSEELRLGTAEAPAHASGTWKKQSQRRNLGAGRGKEQTQSVRRLGSRPLPAVAAGPAARARKNEPRGWNSGGKSVKSSLREGSWGGKACTGELGERVVEGAEEKKAGAESLVIDFGLPGARDRAQ